MLLDLTITDSGPAVRFDAPGLALRDLVAVIRGRHPDGGVRVERLTGFRGTWPPPGSASSDEALTTGVEEMMTELESLLLEGSGPLFLEAAFAVIPAGGNGSATPAPPPSGAVPGPVLPDVPAGGLAYASQEDFLAAVAVEPEEAAWLFGQLYRAVFTDHPGVARGLAPDDAGRLYELARSRGGIHFNPEKWRPDPEGRVSLANLGTGFHFPCHHPPLDTPVEVLRITDTGGGVQISEPFRMDVNQYLDLWYDRPVGCRRFLRAALIGGAVILLLLIVLFLTRR